VSPTKLVPPRPNLGPEPIAETRSFSWPLGVALALVAALFTAWVWTKRRSRKAGSGKVPSSPIDDTTSDTTGIVALAESARAALVARFGADWRARTTEEVADDAGLAESIGPEAVGQLVALLREADRVKFAGVASPPQRSDVEAWALWVASFVAAAGASSTTRGK
jgi:hypothetical protein